MSDHQVDTHTTNNKKSSTAPLSISTRGSSPVLLASKQLYNEMSLAELVAHCTRELNKYRGGEPYTEEYAVELIRRATVQGDQEARACVQHCFGGIVLDWVHHHPDRAAACRLMSEESYVAQAFERFWLATDLDQREASNTLAALLHSLRVCLHGAILDALRTSEQPWETLFAKLGEAREPCREDVTSSRELWKMLQRMLVDRREQRLAYLLFHCGLKPREIVRFCPSEWSDIHAISRLRRRILQRWLNQADHLQ
jgi:hypothetical protein